MQDGKPILDAVGFIRPRDPVHGRAQHADLRRLPTGPFGPGGLEQSGDKFLVPEPRRKAPRGENDGRVARPALVGPRGCPGSCCGPDGISGPLDHKPLWSCMSQQIIRRRRGGGERVKRPTFEADGPMARENDPGPRWRVDRDLREAGCRDATAIRPCGVLHDIAAYRKGWKCQQKMQTTPDPGNSYWDEIQ